jgi:membrane protein implicated in regulation of membrane protease activity
VASDEKSHIKVGGSLTSAIIGVAALAIINICAISYSYGVLNQSVRDLSRRIGQLEGRITQLETNIKNIP